MPKHDTIIVQAKTWTRVTDSTVSALRLQARGPFEVLVQLTADTSPPASAAGAVQLGTGKVILPDTPLALLYPGLSTPAHVWVWSGAQTEVSVSHA